MLKLNDNIIIKKRDNTYFGLNMETGTTYEMNQSQFDIIDFFSKKPNSEECLIDELLKKYTVNVDNLKSDVKLSIDRLVDIGVLIRVD